MKIRKEENLPRHEAKNIWKIKEERKNLLREQENTQRTRVDNNSYPRLDNSENHSAPTNQQLISHSQSHNRYQENNQQITQSEPRNRRDTTAGPVTTSQK